jgi:GMP synthase-like glutamine amidotransferase
MAAPAANNRAGAREIEASMTVVYIDTEHDLILEHPEHGPSHRARIETILNRLVVAAGQSCLVRRFAAVTLAQIEQITPSALVIGGNLTDWSAYDRADLAGLFSTIRAAPVPILGICAGHWLIGKAHGATWDPLGARQPGDIDPDPMFAPRRRKECASCPSRSIRVVPSFIDCRRDPPSSSSTTGSSAISLWSSSSGHTHRGRRFRR